MGDAFVVESVELIPAGGFNPDVGILIVKL
jgi:hypothetical protein